MTRARRGISGKLAAVTCNLMENASVPFSTSSRQIQRRVCFQRAEVPFLRRRLSRDHPRGACRSTINPNWLRTHAKIRNRNRDRGGSLRSLEGADHSRRHRKLVRSGFEFCHGQFSIEYFTYTGAAERPAAWVLRPLASQSLAVPTGMPTCPLASANVAPCRMRNCIATAAPKSGKTGAKNANCKPFVP